MLENLRQLSAHFFSGFASLWTGLSVPLKIGNWAKMKVIVSLFAGLFLAAPESVQEASDMGAQRAETAAAPMPTVSRKPPLFLPANTEILLKMNQEITTKGRKWKEGDTFNLTVVHHIMLLDYIFIPVGTMGVGRITSLTNARRGGVAGEIEIELEYLDLNGCRIDIDGTYRRQGDGKGIDFESFLETLFVTSFTLGLFSPSGPDGRISQGYKLVAALERDLPVALPECR